MKKKGFTLIELLAVIVILAIIALISVPIVLNIVKKAQKEAFQDSVYHIMEGAKLDVIVNERTLPISYVVEDNQVIPNVSFSGNMNAYGEILIDKNGKTKVEVDNGKWCARKGYSDSKLVLSSSPCTNNPIIIGDLTVEIKWGEGLLVTSSAISKSSKIIGYEFKIKKDNQVIDSYSSEEKEHLFSFAKLSNHEQYQIEVEVKDNQNHEKDTNIIYEFSYEPIITRYVVVEVFEHLDGNGAVINELEFLDASDNKLSYTVDSAYDSTTNGVPFYWNNTLYWQKEHLNDEKYSYSSNAEGGTTSTLFIYNFNATDKWSRFLVDFGEEVELKTIDLWTGGNDRRQPQQIKMYRYSLEPDASFISTYIQNRNTSLPCIYDRTFTSVYTTPTMDTNYFIYPKDTKKPIIHDILVNRNYNVLEIEADVTDPYYSSGMKQYRFALVKDNGDLTYETVPWSEIQYTNMMEYDLSSLEEGTYYIYVEATDNASLTAYKTSKAYHFHKKEVSNRYLIMEVYDHFASNGTVITELEFYDSSGNQLTYDIPKVYDSATNKVPYYWTSTAWPKTKLYDGKKTYTSNSQGSSTSTIFNYSSVAGTGKWTRAVIDFGSIKNLNDIKIWLGGPEGRTPKEVNFFVSEENNIDTIYDNNIKVRDNKTLIKVTDFIMSSNVKTVTMFERNNTKIYAFEENS
ncbi:MAG: prepilin-type N-terminal cleavage/methylation domain-containing protein [Bacilli bacterium]|nr:prepilin-type N-terminal cleavage/methylation domain-containing protein [Bacilli bacterium]